MRASARVTPLRSIDTPAFTFSAARQQDYDDRHPDQSRQTRHQAPAPRTALGETAPLRDRIEAWGARIGGWGARIEGWGDHLGMDHGGVVGSPVGAGRNEVHAVGDVERAGRGAGLVGMAVLPHDRVGARVDHEHAVAIVVVDGDVAVGQGHRQGGVVQAPVAEGGGRSARSRGLCG